MADNDLPVSARLLKGAKTLGKLWQEAKCATAGWSVRRTADGKDFEPCACEPKTRFCKAKAQWLKLAAEEPQETVEGDPAPTTKGREIVEGDYGLALTMKGLEWDATGLTLHWPLEGVGTVKVGPKGGLDMKLLMELRRDPASAIAAMKVMMKFPNSKMEFETAESDEKAAGAPAAGVKA